MLTWRKGEGAHKAVLVSVAVELRLSATLAVHRTSGVQVGKPAICFGKQGK